MVPMHDILSVLLGSLVGFSLGLVGGGGSILTVPLLAYVIGQSVSVAIGASEPPQAPTRAGWRRSERCTKSMISGTPSSE